MKKILCVVSLIAVFVSSSFAEWKRIFGGGLNACLIRSTMKPWEDSYDTIERSYSVTTGEIATDGQFRFIHDSSLAFMVEASLGFAGSKIDGRKWYGTGTSCYLGIGKCFSPSDSLDIILSGLVGTEIEVYDKKYYDSELQVQFKHGVFDCNFITGADFFMNKRFTDMVGLYAGCSVGCGIGCGQFTYGKKGRHEPKYEKDFYSETFVVKPRFGVSWTF